MSEELASGPPPPPEVPWWNVFGRTHERLVSDVPVAEWKERLRGDGFSAFAFRDVVFVRVAGHRRNVAEIWAELRPTPGPQGIALRVSYGSPPWVALLLVAVVLAGAGRLAWAGDPGGGGLFGCALLVLVLIGRWLVRNDTSRLHAHVVTALAARIDPLRGAIE